MVVRDRLQEMQEASKYVKEGELDDIEMKPLKGKTGDNNFEEFLEVAEGISTGINTVRKNVDEMKRLQKRILSEPSKQTRDQIQAQYDDLVSSNKVLSKKVQKQLKDEQAIIDKLGQKGSMVSKEYNELRMRKTQISTATTRFLEIWTEYNTDQVEFRDDVKKNLKKNIKITNSAMTDEEIENKIDSGDTDAFSAAIIKETAIAKDQLVAVESRHQEMLKLEKSIVEVHEMFMDLSSMVTMQGEQINRIEDHINSAVIDVEVGRGELFKAQRNKIAANKKKVCLISTGIIIALILLLVILSEFGAFSGGGGSTEKIIEKIIIVCKNVTSEECEKQIEDAQ